MDYEKAYKDALERAKKIIEFYKHPAYAEVYAYAKEDIPSIFPELAESEDEKIKKGIIKFLKENKDFPEDWIAWLKKQDQNKFEEELEKAYKCADEVQYRKGYEDAKREIEKQGEQNPVWSKEDITNYSKVLFCLQTLTFPTDAERKELITWLKKQCEQSSADSYCQENCKGFQETGKCFADGECKAKRDAEQNIEEEFDDFFNLESIIDIVEMYGNGEAPLYGDNVTSELVWLRSLRDRVYWKPTKEQVEAVKRAAEDVFQSSSKDEKLRFKNEPYFKSLYSLYEQLNKL